MFKSMQRIWIIAFILCILFGTASFLTGNDKNAPLRPSSLWTSHQPGPGNATLGFGAIYVLTEDTSTWRVQGLLQVARATGLHLTIPVQPPSSDEDVRMHVGGEFTEGYGHSRALYNHLKILDLIADSPYETVLVMEDDADFSLSIRHQMAALSAAFSKNARPELQNLESRALHPYRDQDWDILWLGHYGMSFIDGTNIVKYNDSYALPWNRLVSKFNNYYEQMAASSVPEPQQLIFDVAPLATYAYAVTRSHAARLAQKLKGNRPEDFDTALHIECVGKSHRCVAPVPQLFHHHRVVGAMASSSTDVAGEDVVQDLAWYRTKHKYTFNIEWSARCNAVGVGEWLGDKWQCLPGIFDVDI